MDIQPGTFIADYIGEVIDEEVADKRGIDYGDEYLFTLDAYGRSRGCQRLHDLGLKHSQQEDRREHYLAMKEETRDGQELAETVVTTTTTTTGSSSSVDKKLSTTTTTAATTDPSDDRNVFKVPIFVSYVSTEHLNDVLGPDLVSAILKSSSVRLDSASNEVHLVGNIAIQQQHMKGSEQSSSSSSSSVSKSKNKKKIKASEKESMALLSTHRVYCRDKDEEKLIKRSRLLAQKEARYGTMYGTMYGSVYGWMYG
jgi:hypothetical protein